jgi:integrase
VKAKRTFTKRVVDELPQPERTTIWWEGGDGALKGFGCRVEPSGRKAFVYQYDDAAGRSKRVTLGVFGAITVDQARSQAKQHAAAVAAARQDPSKLDPAQARESAKAQARAARQAPTVAELGGSYFATERSRLKPRTVAGYESSWRRHVLPAIGNLRVVEVTRAQVEGLHRSLGATPYEANRTLALVRVVFNYAEGRGLRPQLTNPARGIKQFREQSRERYLTPAEIQRLAVALDRAEKEGLPPAPTRQRLRKTDSAKHRPKSAGLPVRANAVALAAIRFLMLSGWRVGEALNLRWEEVDPTRQCATLPDTKTGRSIRPLGAPALELLGTITPLEGSPFVFPGKKVGAPLVEIDRVWGAVRHAAGLADVRLHDLRHTFASAVASAGGSLLMLRPLLGHKDTKTTAKYAHLWDDPVKATADDVGRKIAGWMNNPAVEASLGAPVVPLRSGKVRD